MALSIIYFITSVCFTTYEYMLNGFMELKLYCQAKRWHSCLKHGPAEQLVVPGAALCDAPGQSQRLRFSQVAPQLQQSALVPSALLKGSPVPPAPRTPPGALTHLSGGHPEHGTSRPPSPAPLQLPRRTS